MSRPSAALTGAVRVPVRGRRVRAASASSSADAPATFPRAVRFRPCIDIHQGRVKQIVGGTLKDSDDGDAASETPETNFETETSSAEFARMYRRDGIAGGHVIMLSRDQGTTDAAMAAVSAFPGGLQVGGGVTAETATPLLDAGASHVIVTSYVFRDGQVDQDRLRRLVRAVGKEAGAGPLLPQEGRRLLRRHGPVAEVDRRQGGRGGDGGARVLLRRVPRARRGRGGHETGDRRGAGAQARRALAHPVTYAGGARSIADLELVRGAGGAAVDVTVGSALDCFGGALPYDEVVDWHNAQKSLVV